MHACTTPSAHRQSHKTRNMCRLEEVLLIIGLSQQLPWSIRVHLVPHVSFMVIFCFSPPKLPLTFVVHTLLGPSSPALAHLWLGTLSRSTDPEGSRDVLGGAVGLCAWASWA